MKNPKEQFEYEEKFIVINKKRFNELIEHPKNENSGLAGLVVQMFIDHLNSFKAAYQATTGKTLNQKYYVVNQDEPYAEQVLDLIEQGEAKKKRGITNEEEG